MSAALSNLLMPLALVSLLGACAAPSPQIAIRSGVGQATNLDAIRPPSGATYRYAMESEGVPVPVELKLKSKRRSAKVYDYKGTLTMTLPEADNLEEVGRLIAEALEVTDLNIGVKGNKLIIPVGLRTDNRFRSLASNLVLVESNYSPHDCFAVIGTCRYVASEEGQSIALIAETTEKDGVWRTRTRPDPAKRKPGQQSGQQRLIYSIDRNAILIDMVLTQTQGGIKETIVFRRK